ncbi:AarF/ABC1/UbiB kinase family protein [Candidatus Uhrbacteria bacterium]|nr:AarF/ABC1/UbiB kinase family protein [Candidatus Uhrbacteria bacterium]
MPSLPPLPIKRLKQVVETLYDFGFEIWVGRLKLKYVVPLHKRYMRLVRKDVVPCPLEEYYGGKVQDVPRRFRLVLEHLGGAYVKLGQMMSLRADIVGERIAQELRQLQDRVPSVPYADIKAAIEDEFDRPLSSVFSRFEQKPVGAASLAQVHKAILKDGTPVAVKVLRPGIEKAIRDDMLLLRYLAELAERHIEFTRRFHPIDFVNEFIEWTNKELDLVHEAINTEHFRSLYADSANLFIPRVYWDFTTKRILTMEFSNGIHLDDFKGYRKMKSSRKAIADIGMEIAFRQFFEVGYFHGDPHPGNFFVMSNNTLCLHDFGIVGRISDDMRKELIAFYINFLEKDGEAAATHLLRMAQTDERSDREGFIRSALDEFESWFYAPKKGARISNSLYRVVISGVRHGVRFPSSIALLAKSIVTMESMALLLDPSFNITQRLRPYLTELMKIQLKPEVIAKKGREFLTDSFQILEQLPEAAQKLIALARKGEMPVRLDIEDFERIRNEIDRQSDIRILSLVLIAILITTAIMLHIQGVSTILGIPFSTIGIIASIVLGVQLILRIKN